MTAIIVVGLQYQSLALAHEHVHQLTPLAIVSCPALAHAPRPRNVTANANELFGREEMLVSGVAQDCEASLLVRQLRAKRIGHADLVFRVGARERMRLVVLFQKLVYDDALVENIYAEVCGQERFAVVSQGARVGDDCRVAFRVEILLQDLELRRRRDAFPIHNRYLWSLRLASPATIGIQKRAQQATVRARHPVCVPTQKFLHVRQPEENLSQLHLIGHARRALRVVLKELKVVAVQVSVEPTGHAQPGIARIETGHRPFALGQLQLSKKLWVCERGLGHALEGGGERLGGARDSLVKRARDDVRTKKGTGRARIMN